MPKSLYVAAVSPLDKPCNQILFKSIRIYRMFEKVKIQRYCEPFIKSLFDCIFFGCDCYCCTICLFCSSPTLQTTCWLYNLKQLTFNCFHSSKCHRYLIDCIIFFCSKHKHLFFHLCSTHIVSNAMCFVGWLSIKIIYNFTIIYKYATSMMDYKILSK